MKHTFLRATSIIGLILLLGGCAKTPLVIDSFDACAKAGHVLTEDPVQCITPDGRIFNGKTGEEMPIRITLPMPHAVVQLPVHIAGEARGWWYFEATFPVTIEDLSGNTLFSWYAQADSEWMTEDFVPFSETFIVDIKERTEAVLILQRSNPSGLPENDAEVRIPLVLLPDDGTSPSAKKRAAIEEYIRAHIAELSLTKPVLGGQFFVTDIRWQPDNIAIVSYEDGHIALTIRIRAERDEAGNVVVQEVVDVTEEVLIEKRFEGMVVYGLETVSDLELEKLKMDCQQRNGTFNECGSSCAPDAQACIAACAYTCAFVE